MATGVESWATGDVRTDLGMRFDLEGAHAVLATMHGKERVIAPVLRDTLGLEVEVIADLDTDRFGTFSREIRRTGSQLDAARAKIGAAFERHPQVRVGLASEGSFGPHPYLPFVPIGREIVVLADRETGLEVIGHHADLQTNFIHEVVTEPLAAVAFAERVGFPEQGVIVMGCTDGQPSPSLSLTKTLNSRAEFEQSVERIIEQCGSAFVETDMRAHRNPNRMRAIKRATLDLVRCFRSQCPTCGRPGFVISERIAGVPCSWCGEPTRVIKAEIFVCAGCGHRLEQATDPVTADPGACDSCNP